MILYMYKVVFYMNKIFVLKYMYSYRFKKEYYIIVRVRVIKYKK